MFLNFSFQTTPTFDGYIYSHSVLSKTRGNVHLEHFLAYDLRENRWVKVCMGTKNSKNVSMLVAKGQHFLRITKTGDKLAPHYNVTPLPGAHLSVGAKEQLDALFYAYKIQPLFEVVARSNNSGAAIRAQRDLGDILPPDFAYLEGNHLPDRRPPAVAGPRPAPVMPLMWDRSDSSSQTSEILGRIQCKDIAEGRLQLRVETDDGVRMYQTAARPELLGLFDQLTDSSNWRLRRRVRYGANGEVLAVLDHSVVPA